MVHFPTPIRPGDGQIHEQLISDGMLIDKNLDIALSDGVNVLRCDVFRPAPQDEQVKCYPVIMTAGPYGKDIPYSVFHKQSYAELPQDQKSKWSNWEVPEPTYWTRQGYACIRVDERGSGQSPGFLDTMSSSTSSNFCEAIEWAARQPWCTGKVGLLGISYYAGSQWRVAARQPKGLACIIPWEGMGDYYRDRCRHGGILANGFIRFWQERQINHNQYGTPGSNGSEASSNLPGKAPRPPNVEGVLTSEQLVENRTDQTLDTAANRYMDDEYFASRDYKLSDIKVPTLSVANWGGINLHLRGNIIGYLGVDSPHKWLYCITGRHDLPFYLPEFVDLQRSFLSTFLKGKSDNDGRDWLAGPNAPNGVPAVTYTLRRGNPGFNKTEFERTYQFNTASSWPLKDTRYTSFYLTSDDRLSATPESASESAVRTWPGLTGESVTFSTPPAGEDYEVTGHPVFRGRFSIDVDPATGKAPTDLDVFVTLRHFDCAGQEVFYTGTAGDPAPVTKGWLRASLRKEAEDSTPWLIKRNYTSADVQPVEVGQIYDLAIELWPTNVVVSKGGRLVLEIGPKDQQGCGITVHTHPEDRSESVFSGLNCLILNDRGEHSSRLVLPIIPPASNS